MHVGGEYLKNIASYETGKTVYYYLMIKIPGQIWTTYICYEVSP
jgi:hypothetical protein